MYPYGYYGFYLDPTYILVIVGMVLTMAASAKMNGTMRKYSQIRSMSGMTGEQTAQRILNNAGIYDVAIEHVSGSLTDHYDPRNKVVRLSDAVYNSNSIVAVGVAAHECGHAIQHQEGYLPMTLRSTLVPAANIGSRLGIPIILLGLLLGSSGTLVTIGIWVFSLSVLFQFVTLPVEFNASSRAMQRLEQNGILGSSEIDQCKKVLSAAALTYVAAAAASVLQLLRLVMLFGGRRRDD